MDRNRYTGSVKIFKRADILIPNKSIDLNKWSVIACDQFTSEPEYWDEVKKYVGDSPSALKLILPEVYLNSSDKEELKNGISGEMREYVSAGYFERLANSILYIERKLQSGKIRKGLIGMIDLEQYSYLRTDSARIISSEGTIVSRLPERAQIRRKASLELPHIILFADDREDRIINKRCDSEKVYSVSLMQGGGELEAFRLSDEHAAETEELLAKLAENSPLAVGDGNHSLAAAKLVWHEARKKMSMKEAETSPLRYALVELQNIFDPSVDIEAIHRVIIGCRAEKAFELIASEMTDGATEGLYIELINKERRKTIKTKYKAISELIGNIDELAKRICESGEGRIDYIHGAWKAEEIGSLNENLAILLPRIRKEDIFLSLKKYGPYPRKTFSVGEARDKRYYLEARELS